MNFKSLFSPEHSAIGELIHSLEYPWEILPRLRDIIRELGAELAPDEYERHGEDIWISRSASIAPSASVTGPCIISDGAELRHCALIRGGVLIGRGAVVGNSTEIKNSVLFDGAQVPHYNYVGDSILGYQAHLGAGAVTSNLKGNGTNVTVMCGDARIDTGMRKFGALVGDCADVGCGTVLNPGCVIGRGTQIYPNSSVRGTVGEHKIYKSESVIVDKRR